MASSGTQTPTFLDFKTTKPAPTLNAIQNSKHLDTSLPILLLTNLRTSYRYQHSHGGAPQSLKMFLTMSWFWRGFQSAIFYYLSCAPCSKLAYQRRRRKENKRAKAEKALSEAENGSYVHPQPFEVNPYWQEEIELGPGPPVRKAVRDGKGKPEKRGKSRKSGTTTPLQIGGPRSTPGTGASSADTVIGSEAAELERSSDEAWNKKRYQREDEILWGLENQDTNSTGMAPVSRSASGSRYQYYARNPAINDLHPPVVSTHPTNRTETRWMLQPPPKARIMDGKERADIANRSRSGSGGSYGSRSSRGKASEISLGRQVGERMMETKLKRGEHPPSTGVSRGPSARSNVSARSTAARGQPHDRDLNHLSPPSRSESPQLKLPQPPTLSITTEPSLLSPPHSRPPLSTIPSSSLPQKQKDRPPHLRPQLLSTNSVSSLHMLQELVVPATKLNRNSSPLPEGAGNVKLPPVSHQEDVDLRLPEVESWFPENGLNFPGGKGERTGHAHRWSMDI